MNRILSLCFVTIVCFSATAEETWYAFRGEGDQENLFGFKDKDGTVKISPKFSVFSRTGRFDDVVAVIDDTRDKNSHYFLNKAGKIFGIDQLYTYDMGTDCEYKGTIRFRDNDTQKVGIYDKDGNVVIPAEYSDISRLHGNVAVALKGATLTKDGEHSFWLGGKSLLINRDNQVLVEGFPNSDALDYDTVRVENAPSQDPTRDSFKGVNGKYYHFVNNEKAFTQWLKTFIAKDFTSLELTAITYPHVERFSEHKGGWYSTKNSQFITDNFDVLKRHLQALNSPDTEYQIIVNGVGSTGLSLDKYPELKRYVNNCGEDLVNSYPVMSVVAENTANELGQDHFNFLKTSEGYKLISVTLRSEALR